MVQITGQRLGCLVMLVFGICGSLAAITYLQSGQLFLNSELKWSRLIEMTVDVVNQLNAPEVSDTTHIHLIHVFYEATCEQAMLELEQRISIAYSKMLMINCPLPAGLTADNVITKVNQVAEAGDIEIVIVLYDTTSLTVDLLTIVSQEVSFRWTSIKHTTEWLLVTSSEDEMAHLTHFLDFMTVVYFSATKDLVVSQKSRQGLFQNVSMDITCVSLDLVIDSLTHYSSRHQDISCDNVSTGQFRPSAVHYLRTKQSVLDGLVMPVAVLPVMEDKYYTFITEDNRTVYNGYSMALLDTLSTSMGFTFNLVKVDDGGFYGEIMENGQATGITGLLASREAALTTLPLSITETRRSKVDFTLTPSSTEDIKIIYRLPDQTEHLDLTYLNIIQVKFILYLIGPMLVVGIIGAVIHVLTDSCHTQAPGHFHRDSFKLLATYPDHICFHTDRRYKVQSGLILRTSWAIFWFILSSAYSAYLVTTFVKSPEVSIKTFKQLLEHPEFKVGMTRRDTALQTFFRTTTDKTLSQVWRRLQQCNATDPSTFDPDIEFHIKRVLNGGYAFFLQTPFDPLPVSQYPNIRTHPQKGFETITPVHVAMPKHVFYHQDLDDTMRALEESGILGKIKARFFSSPEKTTTAGKVRLNEAVTFQRVQILNYIVLCGIGLSILLLVFELTIYKLVHTFCKNRPENFAENNHTDTILDSI